jgi:Flp pilus assembly pilin Flp
LKQFSGQGKSWLAKRLNWFFRCLLILSATIFWFQRFHVIHVVAINRGSNLGFMSTRTDRTFPQYVGERSKLVKNLLKRLIVDESGLETVEYAIMLGLVAAATIAAIGLPAAWAQGKFNNISSLP